VIPLSRFQTELLNFFRRFLDEEGRPPHLQEISLRFGIGEDSARIHLCALQREGRLSNIENTFCSHFTTLWEHSFGAVQIPLWGSIPAGRPDNRSQEQHRVVAVPLERLGIKANEQMFALEISGDSMIGKHIVAGDLVVFDKSKTPRDGDVVAALVDNEMTLKTFCKKDGKVFLRAENPAYRDIVPAEELQVQGVMICLLRKQS
jgi:repressor LexA